MGLGNNNAGNRTFLSIGFGKIRQKNLETSERVNELTPGATKRTTQSGNDSWAIEFDYIEGTIEKMTYKEDREYGNSYELLISDAADLFQVSVPEDSRYAPQLLEILPNVNFSDPLKISVYDYEANGKRKVGLTIQQEGNKNVRKVPTKSGGFEVIDSFYRNYDESTGWSFKNGFPDSEGVKFDNKNSLKRYLLEVSEFLLEEFNSRILPMIENKEPSKHVNKTNTTANDPANEANDNFDNENDSSDDLPF